MESIHPMPPETIEPFEAKEPDWKSLYYSLALHVARATTCAQYGSLPDTRDHLEFADQSIRETEEALRLCRSLVLVKTSSDT